MTEQKFNERIALVYGLEKRMREMENQLFYEVCNGNKLNPNKIESLNKFKSRCGLYGYIFE